MIATNRWHTLAASALLVVSATSPADAAQVRYHFKATDLCGTVAQKPGASGMLATKVRYFGLVREGYNCPLKPTHFVTFRHPYTGRAVTVPLAFPEGSPRIEYRSTRVIYNYGSYTVEAAFYRDGSVDTVYNTGFLGR